MRAISLVLCGLIVLATVGACSKSGGGNNVVGNWRLVGYTDYSGFVYVSTDIHSLVINADHTYTMRTGDSVTSSGAYHVEAPTDAERHTVFYISDQRYTDGYNISFSRDTLELEWRGVYAGWGPPVSKYLRR